MTCEISPTAGFIAAASTAVMNASLREPEVAHVASEILLDLARYKPLSRTTYAGHDVILTQDRVSLTVQYGKHTDDVKKGVLGILTTIPEFERLPAREYHR